MPAQRREPDLVEPEGVNADPTNTREVDPHADVRRGGDPNGPRPDEHADDTFIVIPPWDDSDPTAPSLEQSREEGAP
ncbi:MAG: hypothetical protein ACT4QF_21655 [Sporichthyaceae bacterium]